MVRIKHTARRTDKKGKLPPLGPPCQPDTDWGTADKTFYQRFRLPAHPVVANSSDYRRKCLTCSTYFINVYCTVHYVMFDIIDLNKYMYSIIIFCCLYYRADSVKPTMQIILEAESYATGAREKKEEVEARDTGNERSEEIHENNKLVDTKGSFPVVCIYICRPRRKEIVYSTVDKSDICQTCQTE